MKETFGERLRRARICAGLTQQQLADRAGTSQRNVSLLETSDVIGSRFTAAYAQTCGVSIEWLLTGEGPMILDSNDSETLLLKMYRQASPQNKEAILKVAESLAQYEKSSNAPDHSKKTPESATDDDALLQNHRIGVRKPRRIKRKAA